MSELAKALAELQKELPHVGKSQTADTGSYSYDYADLTSITDALMPLLGKHGLAFTARPTLGVQRGPDPSVVDGQFILQYSLLHESGERLDGFYPLPTGNPQAIGSAITYARRYALCAVTGVAPGGSDDDGKAATEYQRHEQAQPKPDPLALARQELAGAWKTKHGSLDVKAIEDAFAQWSEGEIFADATPDRLREFAAVVVAEPEAEQPTPPEKEAKS